VPTGNDDPVVQRFRKQISDNDLKIVDALNARLTLVKQLRAYKEQEGYDLVDPAREQAMLSFVSQANKGPLSDEALAELYRHLVEVSKREAARH
jgi:chorismate mutase